VITRIYRLFSGAFEYRQRIGQRGRPKLGFDQRDSVQRMFAWPRQLGRNRFMLRTKNVDGEMRSMAEQAMAA